MVCQVSKYSTLSYVLSVMSIEECADCLNSSVGVPGCKNMFVGIGHTRVGARVSHRVYTVVHSTILNHTLARG